jgi:hypothetical protein
MLYFPRVFQEFSCEILEILPRTPRNSNSTFRLPWLLKKYAPEFPVTFATLHNGNPGTGRPHDG